MQKCIIEKLGRNVEMYKYIIIFFLNMKKMLKYAEIYGNAKMQKYRNIIEK